MKKWFYAIIERSDLFCLLETGYGSEAAAWGSANQLARQYPDLVQDYDVLYFSTEKERIVFIKNQSKYCLQSYEMGKDYTSDRQ